MSQRELYEELASATGEDVSTVSKMGFIPLTTYPYKMEERQDPLVIDWDLLPSANRW